MLHNAKQSEFPDPAFHFYVLYLPAIVFKTRKSIEKCRTGRMGSCQSQTEVCCAGAIAVCFAVSGGFEMGMGNLGC